MGSSTARVHSITDIEQTQARLEILNDIGQGMTAQLSAAQCRELAEALHDRADRLLAAHDLREDVRRADLLRQAEAAATMAGDTGDATAAAAASDLAQLTAARAWPCKSGDRESHWLDVRVQHNRDRGDIRYQRGRRGHHE